MSASATSNNQVALLKRLHGSKVAKPWYKKSKFLNSIAKSTQFTGEGKYINVAIAPTSGGSADFSAALASQNPNSHIRFFVTRRREYQIFTVENEAIAATEGDKGAMLKIMQDASGGALYAFWRALSQRAWGNGGGSFGQIALTATLSSTTLEFRETGDIRSIDQNMQLEFASDDGTGTSPAGVLGAPTRLTVTGGINQTLGTATMSAALNTVPGLTTSSFIYRRGDYANAMTGVRGYNPINAPGGSDSFFGVNRSQTNVTRNSGIRYTGSSASKEEVLIEALAEAEINGAEDLDTCYVNSRDYADLLIELGAKRERQSENDGGISYKFLEIYGNDGSIKVVSEPEVDQGYFWILRTADYRLETAGECPRMLAGNGGKMLTAYDADAQQGRMGCYGNFFCDNPGNQLIGSW